MSRRSSDAPREGGARESGEPGALDALVGPAGAGKMLRRDREGVIVQVLPADLRSAFAILHGGRTTPGYGLVDLAGVDLSGLPAGSASRFPPQTRFQLLYHFTGHGQAPRVWLAVPVPGRDSDVPTAVPFWPAADWLEREVYDFYGLRFTGHPRLERLLLPKDFAHWPLRRDYPRRGYGEREQALATLGSRPGPGTEAAGDGVEQGDCVSWEVPVHEVSCGPYDSGIPAGMRFTLTLVGDQVTELVPDPGWSHQGVEKLAEDLAYLQFVPVAERLSGVRGFFTGLAFVAAVERLLDMEVPAQGRQLRRAVGALMHVSSHLSALAAQAEAAGSEAAFHSVVRARQQVDQVVGRLTGSTGGMGYLRIGGVRGPAPEEGAAWVDGLGEELEETLHGYRGLLLENRIWVERAHGLGEVGEEQARKWGLEGVIARAAGLESGAAGICGDVGAAELARGAGFDLAGDTRARTWLRWAEIPCALALARGILAELPPGPACLSVLPVAGISPAAAEAPAVVEHFQRWMDGHGLRPAVGAQAYVPVPGPEGEIGFLLVSDGTGRPYRAHLRTPSLLTCQAAADLARGVFCEDVGMLLASLHMDALELDR